MASSISTSAGLAKLAIDWLDVKGKSGRQEVTLNPAITNANAALLLDYMTLMSYAGESSAEIRRGYAAENLSETQTNKVYPTINTRLLFTFAHVDPDNAAKVIYRTVAVPAPRDDEDDDVVTVDGKPNGSNTTVGLFIALLEASLAGVSHSGVPYFGNWVYDGSRSGIITVGAEIES
jgi:hypothetical protein